MTSRWLSRLLCFLWALAPVSAFAQMAPSRVVSTVDVRVLNSERVMAGRIAELTRHQDGSVDLTVRVDETFRGATLPTLQIRLPRNAVSARELSQFASIGAQVLVVGNDIVTLELQGLAVPTASGQLLREPAEVIEYIRETLRGRETVAVGGFLIPLPKQFQDAKISRSFDSNSGPPPQLAVPIDARLEQWAIEAIRSKSDVFSGFRALTSFKSDANIALVMPCLNDSSFDASPNNGLEIRQYRIRRAAYDLLREWGVAVGQPVLREEVPRFEGLEAFSWGNSNAELVWPRVLALSTNLKEVTVVATRPSLQEFSRISELQTVTKISMSARNNGDEWLVPISKLRNLEQLYLRYSNITDKGLRALTGLENLKSIDLSITRVTDDGLITLAGIASLKSINVLFNPHITPAGIAAFGARRPDVQVTWQRSQNERGSINEMVQAGDIESMRRLNERYPTGIGRLGSVDLVGNTPLIYAVSQNQTDIARFLLDRNVDVNVRDRGRATPLLWAAWHGYPGMVGLLLDRQANVTLSDEDGNSPLHVAIERGFVEITRMLVERGAETGARNRVGETPLELADRLRNAQVREVLRSAAGPGQGR